MAVLDLEDGYLDVRDAGKTRERRASGREQLLELCATAKGRTNGRSVAMRGNVAFGHGLTWINADGPDRPTAVRIKGMPRTV